MTHPATRVAQYYRRRELLPDDTIACLEYVLKALFNEWSKVLLYGVLFGCFHLLGVFLLSYLAFVSVRLFAGGIHCKTYWGCFALSLVFLGSFVLLPQIWPLNRTALYVAAVLSCGFPAVLAPMTPTFRVIKDEKKRTLLKGLAVVVSAAWIALARFLPMENRMAETILLTVSVANYQLIVPKFLSYIKRRFGIYQGGEMR